MDNISVPSILAQKGLILDSFSMCFGSDGYGRITFGDTGSSDQGKTPFNLRELHRTYNVTVTQIIVGGNADDLEFHAIFDSGTSYTYLNDPAYTLIAEKFNSLIKADWHSSLSAVSDLPFEYCYDVSPDQSVEIPYLNLTMKGGDDYYVMNPIFPVYSNVKGSVLCLGIQKSGNVNIIGQNFMTGYRLVFDRVNMYLGWKESNCTDEVYSTMAVNPVSTSSNSGKSSPNSSFRMKPIFAYMALPIYLDKIFHPIVAVFLSVTFVLTFGEIIPQAICTKYGLFVGANFVVLVRVLMFICYPIAYPIGKAGKGGELTHDEATIISGALDLTEKA